MDLSVQLIQRIQNYNNSLLILNIFQRVNWFPFLYFFNASLSQQDCFKQLSRHNIYFIQEMALQRDDDIFRDDAEPTCYEGVLEFCGNKSGCLRAWLPCICCCCPYPYKEVKQGSVGLKQRFGRWTKTLDPGLHYINPCTESLNAVSLLTTVLDLQRQKILTKDNITVDIDTCVYYRIVEPKTAFYRIADIVLSVAEVTYATLRTICGQNTLQDLLEKRQQIGDVIEKYVYDKTNKWGIYVEQIFIRDMMIAPELQKDLSMTSKTQRLSKAKIISAQADVKSAKLMHQAADILNSKAAMQIRYLQILQSIAKGGGGKILFLPLASEEFDSNSS